MSTSPNRQAVIVGLFTTLGVAILAGGVLMIGKLNDTFSRKVTVTVIFDEVNGLAQGDNIWFSGMKVGIVKSLAFHGGSDVEVQLKIDEDAMPFIHKDALAKIGADGLIGNKIVVIYAGTPAAPLLENGDVLTMGKTVSSEQMMDMLQANNANLLAITGDLKGISGKIAAGQGSLGKLLSDDALYASVTKSAATLDAASTNARNLTASLASFSADLNRPGSLAHDLVTDKTTYASLTGTVDEVHGAGQRASDLMDGLAKGAADPNTPIGTLVHDTAAGTDLKGSLTNLNRSTMLLSQDLEALQHNFLFRCFFKKKEKAAAAAAAKDTGN